MEQILKPTRLDFLFDADDKTAFRNNYTIKELEERKEEVEISGDRTLVFAWKGIASDYKLYSEHLKESFRERDEDVRSKLWAN